MWKRKSHSLAVLLTLMSVFAAHQIARSETPFAIQSIQPTTNDGIAITWQAATGLVNEVWYTSSLDQPWQILPTARFSGGTNTSASLSFTDFPSADTTQRFYRIRATRPQLIMSLVLDRSGSMQSNGGSTALPPAVTNFIARFDDTQDYAAAVSFSSAASVNVAMEQPFINDIENAALALNFGGYTCSDQGLTNALAQNNAVSVSASQEVVKVIVFFTDG